MEVDQSWRNRNTGWISRNWRRTALWIAAVGLTYATGKLAVELAKWIILMYLAPTAEAKLILVGYLASAVIPVLLLGVPAVGSWYRLFRVGERIDAALVLAVELALLAYVDVGDVQFALANFLQ